VAPTIVPTPNNFSSVRREMVDDSGKLNSWLIGNTIHFSQCTTALNRGDKWTNYKIL
jgi:hypothetical protein